MAVLEGSAATAGIALSVVAVVAFGLAAVAYSLYFTSRTKHHIDTEFFVTARGTMPVARIAWSFFAASMGAWVLYGPAQYVADPSFGVGYLGLISYSFFTGAPLVMIAFMGSYIRKNVPQATSIASFGRWRFGTVVELFIMLLVLFNLGVALAAEYTAIGGIFGDFFGVASWVPIVAVGLMTMAYTATGGLYVSIITDQWQAVISLLLLFTSVIYIGVSFKGVTLPPLPDYLGATTAGWQSFVTLGISLCAATFFSEAMWQRVWASQDSRSLQIGALIGGSLATLAVAVFSFGALLAYWSGRADANSLSNFAFFYAFKSSDGTVSPAVTIIVLLFAVIMNESAVDSFQNAITDTLVSAASIVGLSVPLWAARLIVVAVNVPVMIVGTRGLNIIQLFLVSNMLTSCTFLPLAAGLIPALNNIISPISVILGCLFSFFSVMVYGAIQTGSVGAGLYQYFYVSYDIYAFIIAPVSGIVGLALFAGIELAVRKIAGWPMPSLPDPPVIEQATAKIEEIKRDMVASA
nr:hypothetical protein HK105_005122 [Polyrhizophydium stewartii]